MHQPIHGEEINKILLKPRFKLELNKSETEVIKSFKDCINSNDCKYISKQSGNHFFLDVPKNEEHFWSPQLQIEILKENNKTIIKGILGPKPQVWTMFIFFHFILALAFVVFFVLFYVKWSMEKDYNLYRNILIFIPIIWIVMYFVGQFGKKLAYKQMLELDNFLMKIINLNQK